MTTPTTDQTPVTKAMPGQRDRLASVGDLEVDACGFGQCGHQSCGRTCCDRREESPCRRVRGLECFLRGVRLARGWACFELGVLGCCSCHSSIKSFSHMGGSWVWRCGTRRGGGPGLSRARTPVPLEPEAGVSNRVPAPGADPQLQLHQPQVTMPNAWTHSAATTATRSPPRSASVRTGLLRAVSRQALRQPEPRELVVVERRDLGDPPAGEAQDVERQREVGALRLVPVVEGHGGLPVDEVGTARRPVMPSKPLSTQ